MRRNPLEPVAFVAAISRTEKAILDQLLPMQGGRKWAAETALEEFIQLCENNPALQQQVHNAILESRIQNPPRGTDDFQPRVRHELYERFNKMFGEKGGTTWFLRTWVSSFIVEAERQPAPEENVKRAVRRMLKLDNERPALDD